MNTKELIAALTQHGTASGNMAARIIAEAHAAGLVNAAGEVVKVLGTLPVTADGAIIGDGAFCWFMLPGVKGKDDDKPARVAYHMGPVMDIEQYKGTRQVWSTREAAEAAKSGGGSK